MRKVFSALHNAHKHTQARAPFQTRAPCPQHPCPPHIESHLRLHHGHLSIVEVAQSLRECVGSTTKHAVQLLQLQRLLQLQGACKPRGQRRLPQAGLMR